MENIILEPTWIFKNHENSFKTVDLKYSRGGIPAVRYRDDTILYVCCRMFMYKINKIKQLQKCFVWLDTYTSCVVTDGEVTSHATWLCWPWLLEVGWLSQMVAHQLLLKGLVSSFGEHRLFLKDWQDTHRLKETGTGNIRKVR